MIPDADCVEFLRQVLPRLGLRWEGFRKVRRLVCKRLGRRLRELGLPRLDAYREHLQAYPAEWRILEGMCRVPVSRFYRDRAVFEALELEVLPSLARAAVVRRQRELFCWSACCASGEEPYTLAVVWRMRLAGRFPELSLRILATDIDGHLLERARSGCYRASSLKALPQALRMEAFVAMGSQLCLKGEFRKVEFAQQDIRQRLPDGPFDLILCRNAVLTYFAESLRRSVMKRTVALLRAGGALVIGTHESLPEGLGLEPWPDCPATYRKRAAAPSARRRS
jgi:chemotaxis protein methyltransferase CheR